MPPPPDVKVLAGTSVPCLISIFHFGLVAWAGSGKDAVCCPEWGNLLPNSFKHCAEVTGMLAGEARFPAPLVST